MTCKDCIHFDVCEAKNYPMLPKAEDCNDFKDKSRFIELPCKVGDTVYVIGEIGIAEMIVENLEQNAFQFNFHARCSQSRNCDCDYEDGDPCLVDEEICYMGFSQRDIGKTVFLTREEAEKALKESEKNDTI